MPSIEEQDQTSGAAFTPQEIGRVMKIIQDKSYPDTKGLCDALTLFDADGETPLADEAQALRQQTRAEMIVFFDQYGDGTIKAGEDYDQSRDKEEIRQSIRLRFGLPAISTAVQDAARALRRTSQTVASGTVFNG